MTRRNAALHPWLSALARRWQSHPGRVRRLLRSALFDAHWYLQRHPDLPARMTLAEAARHYLRHGAEEGRDPGPGFSTSGYLVQARTRGLTLGLANPLLHYLSTGQSQGLKALPSLAGGCPRPGAPVILFAGHQALAHVFGAEQSLLHMLDRAARAGLAAEVVLPQALSAAYLDQVLSLAQRVHLRPYGWRRGGDPADPAAVAELAALMTRIGAVALHQNTAVPDVPLAAARKAGLPAVVWLRELPAEDAELCGRLGLAAEDLRQALLSEADRFIANSDAVARWIDAPERCVTLLNSVDEGLFDLPFAPQDPLRVGLISSNTTKKGLEEVLAVARLCEARYPVDPPFRFVLVGPPSADLDRLSPLPKLVRHVGYAAGPQAALAEVDVVLSLSRFAESFGRTVHEALAAGRPVICHDLGTPPDLVGRTAGLEGQVVPVGDPGAVLSALERLRGAPLATVSAAARARARELGARAAAVADDQLFPEVFVPRKEPAGS